MTSEQTYDFLYRVLLHLRASLPYWDDRKNPHYMGVNNMDARDIILEAMGQVHTDIRYVRVIV